MPYSPSPANQPYKFGLSPKTFLNYGKECRKQPDNLIDFSVGLEQILQLESQWSMIDTIQPLNKVHINFTGEQPSFQFVHKSSKGQECLITNHAIRQIANYIKPSLKSGQKTTPYNITEATCLIDEEYRKLATVMWSKLLGSSDKEVLFRSKVIDGQRVITSVQSTKYACIKDSQLLKNLLSLRPHLMFCSANINSISSNYKLIDTQELELRKPTGMYDLYNSDGGLRGLHLMYKMWMLICANGMMGWRTGNSFYTRHFGDSDILLGRFADQVNEFSEDKEFINAYMKARTMQVDNLYAIMEHRLGLNTDELHNLALAMNSKYIASEEGSVASGLDAITLSAQAKSDPYERHMLECKATDFMTQLMSDIENKKELIPAELLEIG